MAFTGVPTAKLVADNVVRLSGFGLAAGAQGTIGLFGTSQGSDVILPEAFKARPYANGLQEQVSLADSIQIDLVPVTVEGLTPMPGYTIAKAGSTPEDFEVTVDNPVAEEGGDLTFEIYVRFH